MPISSGGSGVPGNQARQYPWQVDHYIIRGGPNDPTLQTGPVLPAAQVGGGVISWNSQVTLGPVPGQSANRTMGLNSTGTLAGGQLTGNTGGILLGTIPQGAWIDSIQLQCLAALSVGTSVQMGLFYCLNSTDLVYPPPTLNLLAYITSPAANAVYSVMSGAATAVLAFTAVLGAGTTAGTTGTPIGPGNPTAAGIGQLASLGDIDIYAATFLIAGAGTASSTGVFSARVNFSGSQG